MAGKDAIIESIRAIGEVEKMRENADFILLSVDAPQDLRYQRAIARKSAKDAISWEKFQEQEALEAANQDPTQQNVSACQALADVYLINDGGVEQLWKQIEDKVIGL